MTGSLSNPESSPQWAALEQARDAIAQPMADQPEAWWRDQAESLAKGWLASGLPTKRLEEWMYTSLAPLHAKARMVKAVKVAVKADPAVLVTPLSRVALEKSLSVEDRALIRRRLLTGSQVFFERFAKSLVADPVVVWIPGNFKSDVPVEIHWPSLPEGSWGAGVIAIIVGEGAAVSIVERYGENADALAVTTLIDAAASANVSHLRLQIAAPNNGVILANVHAQLAETAKYQNVQVSSGGLVAREDLTVELLGAGAEATADGVFIGRGQQVLDHHTNLVHRVGSTVSRQIYKGILSEEARGVFNGRIAISKNASGSNSSQMNKNLLLSKKVELDTKPQLEIDNDDVKAAHGAAIGRLDAEHVFYLRSRGITLGTAVEMLARGFAFEAVARLDSMNLRRTGTKEIERALSGLSWEMM